MVRISQVPNVAPDVISKLSAMKVWTQADLWETIGEKFPEGIERVAKQTEIPAEQLYEILKHPTTPSETKDQGGFNRFFFRALRHWREVVALTISVILLSLLVWNATQRRDTLVVNAVNGLPAFHIIRPNDVQSKKMFAVHDSLTPESDVIGRYLLQPVSHQAVLLNSQLAPPTLKDQLTGRETLTLPVKTGAISSTLAPGSRVRLLFSPRSGEDLKTSPTQTLSQIIADLVIDDVIVLSANRRADSSSITVAFKNTEDLNRALTQLTTSEIFISELINTKSP